MRQQQQRKLPKPNTPKSVRKMNEADGYAQETERVIKLAHKAAHRARVLVSEAETFLHETEEQS